MSLKLKRFRDEEQIVNGNSVPKKFKQPTYIPNAELVNPYSFDKNLARLICFFQNVDQRKIEEVLTSCDNNLENATDMLNNLTIGQSIDQAVEQTQPIEQFYGDQLCEKLKNVQSLEEASVIAQAFFRQYADEVKKQQKPQQEQMAFTLQKLKQDTEVLKKGVRLLVPKATLGQKVETIQKENNQLKEYIQKLKLENYSLKMQIGMESKNLTNEWPPALY